MGFDITTLWKAPEVNPVNHKARSLPILNVFNVYGRVFNFSWLGFFIAFLSWYEIFPSSFVASTDRRRYAWPPLLADIIAKDIHATPHMVANSNVIALTATYVFPPPFSYVLTLLTHDLTACWSASLLVHAAIDMARGLPSLVHY